VVKARLRGDSRKVSTSGWPALQISRRADLPSTSALVETVVPWTIRIGRREETFQAQPMGLGGERKASMKRARSRRASSRFEDLEAAILRMKHRSVKVPPISTQATNIQLSFFPLSKAGLSAEAKAQALGVRKKIDPISKSPTSRRAGRSGSEQIRARPISCSPGGAIA